MTLSTWGCPCVAVWKIGWRPSVRWFLLKNLTPTYVLVAIIHVHRHPRWRGKPHLQHHYIVLDFEVRIRVPHWVVHVSGEAPNANVRGIHDTCHPVRQGAIGYVRTIRRVPYVPASMRVHLELHQVTCACLICMCACMQRHERAAYIKIINSWSGWTIVPDHGLLILIFAPATCTRAPCMHTHTHMHVRVLPVYSNTSASLMGRWVFNPCPIKPAGYISNPAARASRQIRLNSDVVAANVVAGVWGGLLMGVVQHY